MIYDVPLRERMQGKWPAVLPQLGLDTRYLRRRNMPCPWCGGKDRFRFIDTEGSGNWVCNQCGRGDGIMLAERLTGADFAETAKRIEALLGTIASTAKAKERDKARERAAMHRLWTRSRAIRSDDPAWRYLAGRGIELPDCAMSDALRYCADCEYDWHQTKPALLARLISPDGKQAVNVQRLFLTKDGGKADIERPRRMMPGETPLGSCVRLGRPRPRMGVAEGIESALAASKLHRIPTWAVLGTANMEAFIAPVGVEELVVFADNDENYAGHAAAYRLANKAVTVQKLKAAVMLPPNSGDWNDALLSP